MNDNRSSPQPPGRRDVAPRLCRGLSIVSSGSALLIEGGPRRHRLSGKAATEVLPKLFPLLDGRRDRQSICTKLNLAPQALDQVLRLLDDCDLLESAPSGPAAAPGPAPHVTEYLSRNIHSFGGYGCAEEVVETLADAVVVLSAPAGIGRPLARDLLDTGVRSVLLDPEPGFESEARALTDSPRGLLVIYDDPGRRDPERFHELMDLGDRAGVPVLRIAGTSSHIELGPTFLAGHTACGRCFARGYQELTEEAAESGQAASTQNHGADAHDVLIGLAAAEILGILTRTQRLLDPRQMIQIASTDYAATRYDMLPQENCPVCDRGGREPDGPEVRSHIERYEWFETLLPPALQPAATTSSQRRQMLSDLAVARKETPYTPRLSLHPDAVQPQKIDGSTGADLDSRAIAEILARVGGRRPEEPEVVASAAAGTRWAPSGGDLGSVEIYGVTENPLFDLPATVFRYHGIRHEVAAVRSDQLPLEHYLQCTDLLSSDVDIMIVLVGAVGRIRPKYGTFSTRLAHLDAGCAALQMATTAADRDLQVEFASKWTDQLGNMLDLDTRQEIITAVAGIRRERTGTCH